MVSHAQFFAGILFSLARYAAVRTLDTAGHYLNRVRRG